MYLQKSSNTYITESKKQNAWKVAKLVIERATVIFNLLARHLTRWSCRASERYNVLARTGPVVWKVRRASGPVLMLRAALVDIGSMTTK